MSMKDKLKPKMGFETRRFQKNYNNTWVRDTIGGKEYNFRSKGEHRLAKYLELLKVSGHIRDWLYENTTFCFPSEDDPVKTWLVDFDVLENDGCARYGRHRVNRVAHCPECPG